MATPLDEQRRVTLAEYEAMHEEELYRVELSHGLLVREPGPAGPHGWVSPVISHRLMTYLEERPGIGRVYGPAGFVLAEDPPTVRIPDLAFRAGVQHFPPPGLLRCVPDLAIEVLSPSNRAAEMARRIADLLEAGARTVWVFDPMRKTVIVHDRSGTVRVLRGSDRLEQPELLPGFSCAVAEFFAE